MALIIFATLLFATACGSGGAWEAEAPIDVHHTEMMADEPTPEMAEASPETATEPEAAPEPAAEMALETESPAISPEERVRQWTYDIEQVRRQVLTIHPKFTDSRVSDLERNINMRAAFDASLSALADSVDTLTDFEVSLGIQRALALLEDSHLAFDGQGHGVSFANSLRQDRYPLTFQWLSDGFYLLHVHRDFSDALNHKLFAVNGIGVEALFAEIGSFWGVENIYNARTVFAFFLSKPGILYAIGAAEGRDVTFTFVGTDGEWFDITLTESDIFFVEDWWLDNRLLSEDMVYERMTGAMPFMYRDPHINHWYEYMEAYGILYIRIRAYFPFGDSEVDFIQTFEAVETLLATNHVNAVVIDARGNGGGDSRLYIPHFEMIAAHTPTGRLFYFMDEGSFSASLVAAAELYRLGAVFVGKPSGQLTEFYSYSTVTGVPRDQRFWTTLRYSGYTLAVPNTFHTLRDVGIAPYDLILRPHVLIDSTIDDWINNRDPLLDYVISLVATE